MIPFWEVKCVGTLLRTQLWFLSVCVNLSLVSLSDCVQFQSDNDQSGVPAGQGVCRAQRRHLGPQRHQEPTGGAGYSICRCFTQSLSYTASFIFSSDVSFVFHPLSFPFNLSPVLLCFVYLHTVVKWCNLLFSPQTTLRCCGALRLESASSNIWATKDQVMFLTYMTFIEISSSVRTQTDSNFNFKTHTHIYLYLFKMSGAC